MQLHTLHTQFRRPCSRTLYINVLIWFIHFWKTLFTKKGPYFCRLICNPKQGYLKIYLLTSTFRQKWAFSRMSTTVLHKCGHTNLIDTLALMSAFLMYLFIQMIQFQNVSILRLMSWKNAITCKYVCLSKSVHVQISVTLFWIMKKGSTWDFHALSNKTNIEEKY